MLGTVIIIGLTVLFWALVEFHNVEIAKRLKDVNKGD